MNLSNGSNHFPIPQAGALRIWVWARNVLLGLGAPTDGPRRHRATDYCPVHPQSNRNRKTVGTTISQHPTIPSLLKAAYKHTIQSDSLEAERIIKHHENKQTEGVNRTNENSNNGLSKVTACHHFKTAPQM